MPENFITTKWFLRNYLVFTLVVSLVHFTLFYFRYELPLLIAVTDALVSASLLDFVLLSLYYVVKYARSESISSITSIRNSLIAGVLLVSGWLFSSQWLLQNLFSNNHFYLEFLHDSIALRFIAGLFICSLVYLSFFLTIYQSSVRDALKRENELKVMIQRTELQALKNQLNPHFIYNSLNSISALTIYSPEKAREMVSSLSDFLRIALKQDAMQMTTLEEEVKNIELYLSIEKVRFEEKLNWEFHISPNHTQARLPVMILQPLFENAVKHGVQQISNSSPVKLISHLKENTLEVIVENGFDPQFQRFKGEGVGLENIRNRMRLIYGRSQLIKTELNEQNFRVRLLFPQEESPATKSQTS